MSCLAIDLHSIRAKPERNPSPDYCTNSVESYTQHSRPGGGLADRCLRQ